MNPFRFRPPPGAEDWEDNWLSNALAYFSLAAFPHMCDRDTPAVKIALYFWAECPCCYFYRGAIFGAVLGLPIGITIGKLI